MVIFAYFYYRVGVVYESVCNAYACGLCDAVFEIDGSSEACLSEVAVGVCLMDSSEDGFSLIPNHSFKSIGHKRGDLAVV